MDRKSIRNALAVLIEDTTGEPCPALSDDQDLRSSLGLDSVDLFSLVIETQTKFGIKIASEELLPVNTVGDYLDLVEAKVPAAAPAASAA